MNTYRVEKVKRQIRDGAGFVTISHVFCVVNQQDYVYAVFWAGGQGEQQAHNYKLKLSPTMRPPALGGHIDGGYYSK